MLLLAPAVVVMTTTCTKIPTLLPSQSACVSNPDSACTLSGSASQCTSPPLGGIQNNCIAVSDVSFLPIIIITWSGNPEILRARETFILKKNSRKTRLAHAQYPSNYTASENDQTIFRIGWPYIKRSNRHVARSGVLLDLAIRVLEFRVSNRWRVNFCRVISLHGYLAR